MGCRPGKGGGDRKLVWALNKLGLTASNRRQKQVRILASLSFFFMYPSSSISFSSSVSVLAFSLVIIEAMFWEWFCLQDSVEVMMRELNWEFGWVFDSDDLRLLLKNNEAVEEETSWRSCYVREMEALVWRTLKTQNFVEEWKGGAEWFEVL